jgi:hypothetical protein
MVHLGQAGEAGAVDLVLRGGGDHAVGDNAQGGGPGTPLQQGALAYHRSGAELADLSAAHPDAEHLVEQQALFAALKGSTPSPRRPWPRWPTRSSVISPTPIPRAPRCT